ncbi:MAG: hypothetical protein ACTS4Y_00325 [Candidatus Hodgkinia cicadicola]
MHKRMYVRTTIPSIIHYVRSWAHVTHKVNYKINNETITQPIVL